jgi:hypothetical protein
MQHIKKRFVEIFKHEGHSVYNFFKLKKIHLLILREKPPFYIYKKGEWFINYVFKISANFSFRYSLMLNFSQIRIFIRLPFFIIRKDNCNIYVGTNKRQLWIQTI